MPEAEIYTLRGVFLSVGVSQPVCSSIAFSVLQHFEFRSVSVYVTVVNKPFWFQK